MDQPAGAGRTNPYAAESWLDPWLIKHSGFYRKHFASDGRRESRSTRRSSAAGAVLESRRESALTQADVEGTGGNLEEPQKANEHEYNRAEKTLKQEKYLHGWRRGLTWFL